MTTHARYEDLAAAAIDFHLTSAEQTTLDGHLETCSACRAAASGYEADASRLRAMAFAEPPARVRSAILATTIRPAAHTIEPWKILVAAALLLGALVGVTLAVGAWNTRSSLVMVVPVPSGSPESSAPVNLSPREVPSVAPTPYAPPPPACPAPATAARLPTVAVSVRSAPSKSATLWDSQIVTCSNVGTGDGVASTPTAVFPASPGDQFTLVLPSGWSFLHIVPIDQATTTDAIARPAIDTPGRPSRIQVPVTADPGESTVGFQTWIISDDERTLATLEIGVRVQLSSEPSIIAPSVSPGATP